MLKKLPLVLASTSLLVMSIAPVFAEDMMTTAAAPTTTTTSAATTLNQVVQPTVKAMRAEAKATLQDAMSKAKAAFKEKLAIIKDEQKKTTVETIDTKIETVNKNRTDEMTANLTKLSQILDSISSKSATAKAAGQDTTTVEKDITAARAAITAAQTAVTAQAAKTYTITITTETKLRVNVMATLTQFRKDLEAAHKKVVTAREGVRVAALDLEKANTATVVNTTPTPTASTAATNQ